MQHPIPFRNLLWHQPARGLRFEVVCFALGDFTLHDEHLTQSLIPLDVPVQQKAGAAQKGGGGSPATARDQSGGGSGASIGSAPGPLAVVEAWLSEAAFTLPFDQDPGTAERFTELWAKAFKAVCELPPFRDPAQVRPPLTPCPPRHPPACHVLDRRHPWGLSSSVLGNT